jgi:DNA polymerase-1
LAPILADPAMTIIAHNAKFDYEVSRAWGLPRWKAAIWDTMVAAWLCDPGRTAYSLEAVASYHLNLHGLSYNDIVPKDEPFNVVDLELAGQYSCEDADFCLRLKLLFEDMLDTIGAKDLFWNLEMPLLPILAEMEGAGIKIDAALLRDYGVELGQQLDALEAETWKLVGHSFNLASPKQLQHVLFEERKLKPGKKTKTGYSTDVAVLEELARIDKAPELILRHRSLAKLKSTYVDTLAEMADESGRLHTSFVQTGTATGRLSSRDPNLQNIPIRAEEGRRIRESFIAAEGNVLISADYSQIELVVLAHLSQDAALIGAFTEGKDVHARTAALIFGVDEDHVDAAQRRIAKTINFGVMYGMSAFRLSNELNISRREAAMFIEAYFKTYSGVREFIDRLIAEAEKSGYASTLFGRRRAIPTINSSNRTEKAQAERMAVNTPIQGSAADIVKRAMINLDATLRGGSLGAGHSPASPDSAPSATAPASGGRSATDAAVVASTRLLLQVHDELILECPKEYAQRSAVLVRTIMENAVTLSIPLRVGVEIGQRWGDFH